MKVAHLSERAEDHVVFSDGLGVRVRALSEAGEPVQRFTLHTAFTPVQQAVQDRVTRLVNLHHVKFGRIRGFEKAPKGGAPVIVMSDVEGRRLSDVLLLAGHGLVTLDAGPALQITREVLAALTVLHDSRNVTHGSLAPERVVLTPHGRAVVVEHVLSQALDKLQLPRHQLWRDWRIATPPAAGPVRFDARTDLAQVGLLVLALVLGRPIEEEEYPHHLRGLLPQVQNRLGRSAASRIARDVQSWLERLLPIESRNPFTAVKDAQLAFEALVSSPGASFGMSPARVKALLSACAALEVEAPAPDAAPAPAPATVEPDTTAPVDVATCDVGADTTPLVPHAAPLQEVALGAATVDVLDIEALLRLAAELEAASESSPAADAPAASAPPVPPAPLLELVPDVEQAEPTAEEVRAVEHEIDLAAPLALITESRPPDTQVWDVQPDSLVELANERVVLHQRFADLLAQVAPEPESAGDDVAPGSLVQNTVRWSFEPEPEPEPEPEHAPVATLSVAPAHTYAEAQVEAAAERTDVVAPTAEAEPADLTWAEVAREVVPESTAPVVSVVPPAPDIVPEPLIDAPEAIVAEAGAAEFVTPAFESVDDDALAGDVVPAGGEAAADTGALVVDPPLLGDAVELPFEPVDTFEPGPAVTLTALVLDEAPPLVDVAAPAPVTSVEPIVDAPVDAAPRQRGFFAALFGGRVGPVEPAKADEATSEARADVADVANVADAVDAVGTVAEIATEETAETTPEEATAEEATAEEPTAHEAAPVLTDDLVDAAAPADLAPEEPVAGAVASDVGDIALEADVVEQTADVPSLEPSPVLLADIIEPMVDATTEVATAEEATVPEVSAQEVAPVLAFDLVDAAAPADLAPEEPVAAAVASDVGDIALETDDVEQTADVPSLEPSAALPADIVEPMAEATTAVEDGAEAVTPKEATAHEVAPVLTDDRVDATPPVEIARAEPVADLDKLEVGDIPFAAEGVGVAQEPATQVEPDVVDVVLPEPAVPEAADEPLMPEFRAEKPAPPVAVPAMPNASGNRRRRSRQRKSKKVTAPPTPVPSEAPSPLSITTPTAPERGTSLKERDVPMWQPPADLGTVLADAARRATAITAQAEPSPAGPAPSDVTAAAATASEVAVPPTAVPPAPSEGRAADAGGRRLTLVEMADTSGIATPAPASAVITGVAEAVAPTPMIEVERRPRTIVVFTQGVNWRRTAAAAVLLAVLESAAFAAAWWWVQPGAKGTLVVQTSVPGVEVLVDGKSVGHTPFHDDLRPGRHTLTLRRGGLERNMPVEISLGVVTTQTLSWPDASTGALRVTSSPEGANVLLGGRVRGRTPLTLDGLSAGRHTLHIRSTSGTVSATATVVAGETVTVDVPIFAGWVQIHAPVELSVSVDGTRVGTSLDGQILLAPGTHRVEVASETLGSRRDVDGDGGTRKGA